MALQSNVNVSLVYGAETTFGAPSSAAGNTLRRVSSTLAAQKDAFTSNEVRADQQISDARHGTRRAQGVVNTELSIQSFDDLIAAALRSTWVAGVSATNTTLTNVLAAAAQSRFTFGAGSLITAGFKVGDVVRFSTITGPNANRNFRITALTATQMTVFPAPADMTSQTTFTVAVQGRKLVNGILTPSFTIEQYMSEIDVNELFTGMRVGEMALSLPPSGIATANFSFQGKDATVGSGAGAPYFTNPAAQPNTGVLAGVNGSLTLNGSASAIVTGLDLTINNNLSSTPVVGSQSVPEIFYGRSVVTGNVSAYLDDAALLNVFMNEAEVDIVAQLEAAGSDPKDFLVVNMQRVKFTGVNKTVGPDGGVVATFPFQALLKTGGAGTTFDQSTLVIQRSNA
jgi:hypothetical protein